MPTNRGGRFLLFTVILRCFPAESHVEICCVLAPGVAAVPVFSASIARFRVVPARRVCRATLSSKHISRAYGTIAGKPSPSVRPETPSPNHAVLRRALQKCAPPASVALFLSEQNTWYLTSNCTPHTCQVRYSYDTTNSYISRVFRFCLVGNDRQSQSARRPPKPTKKNKAADEESRSRVLREILEPFLKNADLVKAMFAAGSTPPTAPPKNLTAEAVKENTSAGDDEDPADATTATSPHIDGSGIGKGSREQEEGMDDAWLQPPPPTTTAATASGVESQHPGSCPSVENEEQPGIRSWGYLSSLAARGGWKVDAAEIARRDDSVELKFDSIAFDVFVRTGDRGSERWVAIT